MKSLQVIILALLITVSALSTEIVNAKITKVNYALICKKKRKKQVEVTQTGEVDNLIISFISLGAGIDGNSTKTLEDAIIQFQNTHNTSLTYEIIKWGREGERDYCINCADKNKLAEFSAQITTTFKGNRRIFVTPNGTCKNK